MMSVANCCVAVISKATTARVGVVSLTTLCGLYYLLTVCKNSAHYGCLVSVRPCNSMPPPGIYIYTHRE